MHHIWGIPFPIDSISFLSFLFDVREKIYNYWNQKWKRWGPCESELINTGILWPYTALVVTKMSHVRFQRWPVVEVSTCFSQKPCSDQPEFECKTQPVSVLWVFEFLPTAPNVNTDTHMVVWLYLFSPVIDLWSVQCVLHLLPRACGGIPCTGWVIIENWLKCT